MPLMLFSPRKKGSEHLFKYNALVYTSSSASRSESDEGMSNISTCLVDFINIS